MTTQCPMCQSEIEDTHPALLLNAVRERVSKLGGWGTLADQGIGYDFSVENSMATVVEVKDNPGYPSHYGEYDQGTTFDAKVVIQIRDTFFMKTGTGDSYGDVSWDGDLRIVTPVEKVVRTFE